jgi:hypothetical protein
VDGRARKSIDLAFSGLIRSNYIGNLKVKALVIHIGPPQLCIDSPLRLLRETQASGIAFRLPVSLSIDPTASLFDFKGDIAHAKL